MRRAHATSWVQSDQMVRQRAKLEINSCLCMPKGVKENQNREKKTLQRQGHTDQIRNDRTKIKSEIPASQREIKSRDCQENVSYLQDCIEQPEIWIPSTLETSQKQNTTHLIYKEDFLKCQENSQDCNFEPELWIPSTVETSKKQNTTTLIYKEDFLKCQANFQVNISFFFRLNLAARDGFLVVRSKKQDTTHLIYKEHQEQVLKKNRYYYILYRMFQLK